MLPSQASIQSKGCGLLCMCLLQFMHRHSFIAFTSEVFAASSSKVHTYQGTKEQHHLTALLALSHGNSLLQHTHQNGIACSMQFNKFNAI